MSSNEWTCTQLEQFIIFNSLKFPNEEQSMNSVVYLFQGFKFRGDNDKMKYLTRIKFNTMNNSSDRYEEWCLAKLDSCLSTLFDPYHL